MGAGPGPWGGCQLSWDMQDGDRRMHFVTTETHLIPRSRLPRAGPTGLCLMGRCRNKMGIVQQVDAHLCLLHHPESGTCLPVLLSACPAVCPSHAQLDMGQHGGASCDLTAPG